MIWATAAALFAVLVLSAFFSGSETAFMAVRLHRLRALAVKNRRAAAVLRVAQHPERFLGAILTGNVFANVLAGVLITIVLSSGAETTEERARAATISTLIVGAGLLIFGEMVPKSIASRHSERWSLSMIRPVQAVLWLLGPIASSLSWLVTAVLGVLGISRPAREEAISAAEMRASLRWDPGGDDEEVEKELLIRLVEATGRRLTEVMTPRRAIVAAAADAGPDQVMRLFRAHGHTRMPVVGESLDDVKGLLDLRAALPSLTAGDGFDLNDHLLPARFCPDTATLAQALVQMREPDSRMLIVVDEHGGVEGLVTSGSLLDAVRGRPWQASAREPDGSFVLDGTLTVSEANDELAGWSEGGEPAASGIEIPAGDDYDTLAGFVLERIGHIPKPGESVRIPGAVVSVETMEAHRVVRVRIEPAPSEGEEAGESSEASTVEEAPDASDPGS